MAKNTWKPRYTVATVSTGQQPNKGMNQRSCYKIRKQRFHLEASDRTIVALEVVDLFGVCKIPAE
jgi:hypothetical protein